MKHKFDFWIDLNKWSHVVLVVDVRRVVTSLVSVYVNGYPTQVTESASYLPEHLYYLKAKESQLTIGVKGTYDMDDLWFVHGVKFPHTFYGKGILVINLAT